MHSTYMWIIVYITINMPLFSMGENKASPDGEKKKQQLTFAVIQKKSKEINEKRQRSDINNYLQQQSKENYAEPCSQSHHKV